MLKQHKHYRQFKQQMQVRHWRQLHEVEVDDPIFLGEEWASTSILNINFLSLFHTSITLPWNFTKIRNDLQTLSRLFRHSDPTQQCTTPQHIATPPTVGPNSLTFHWIDIAIPILNVARMFASLYRPRSAIFILAISILLYLYIDPTSKMSSIKNVAVVGVCPTSPTQRAENWHEHREVVTLVQQLYKPSSMLASQSQLSHEPNQKPPSPPLSKSKKSITPLHPPSQKHWRVKMLLFPQSLLWHWHNKVHWQRKLLKLVWRDSSRANSESIPRKSVVG